MLCRKLSISLLRGFNIKPRDKYNKNMTAQLHTKKGTGREIAKLLRVSEQTVSKAIRGKSDTKIARKIRTLAVRSYGAVELKEN